VGGQNINISRLSISQKMYLSFIPSYEAAIIWALPKQRSKARIRKVENIGRGNPSRKNKRNILRVLGVLPVYKEGSSDWGSLEGPMAHFKKMMLTQFFLFFHFFICVYNVWVISPPYPLLPPFPLPPPSPLIPPRF
jgi:hypothetical protein